jgi:hypothetical protein
VYDLKRGSALRPALPRTYPEVFVKLRPKIRRAGGNSRKVHLQTGSKRDRSWKISRVEQYRDPEALGAPGLASDPLAGTEMFGAYPSFQELFAETPEGGLRCERLLALELGAARALREVLDQLDRALRRSPDPDAELAVMLSERDWRPHIVAAAALAIEGGSRGVFFALWRAIDRGSPVGPQLAVAASLTDELFEEEARRRIELRCPITAPAPLCLSTRKAKKPQRDRAPTRSPQLLSALLALARQRQGAMAWLALHLADPEVSALIDEDTEGGGNLSLSWRDRLLEALALAAS